MTTQVYLHLEPIDFAPPVTGHAVVRVKHEHRFLLEKHFDARSIAFPLAAVATVSIWHARSTHLQHIHTYIDFGSGATAADPLAGYSPGLSVSCETILATMQSRNLKS